MSRVLIVEPDAALREALAACIDEAGFEVALASASYAGDAAPPVAVVDVRGVEDVRAVEALARRGSLVVALVGPQPRRLAIDALRAGAWECLPKPFELRALERALAGASHALRRPGRDRLGAHDASVRRLAREAEAAARSDATLQLVGEPGTGRHRLARHVHAASMRRDGPFISLADGDPAELTAAFAAARDGTLVVDEPAALAAAAQDALSLLAHEPGPRLVTISRTPLRDDERLRADLRLRLDVLLLAVPPLRERPAELVRLARELAARSALTRGVAPPLLTPRAVAALRSLPLPGNARELATLMERATALFAGRELDVDALLRGRTPERMDASAGEPAGLDLARLERAAIEEALLRTQGNRTHAARALGISVRTLRNKIRAYAQDDDEAARSAPGKNFHSGIAG